MSPAQLDLISSNDMADCLGRSAALRDRNRLVAAKRNHFEGLKFLAAMYRKDAQGEPRSVTDARVVPVEHRARHAKAAEEMEAEAFASEQELAAMLAGD